MRPFGVAQDQGQRPEVPLEEARGFPDFAERPVEAVVRGAGGPLGQALAVVVAVALGADNLLSDLDGRASAGLVRVGEPDPLSLPAHRPVTADGGAASRHLPLEWQLTVDWRRSAKIK